MVKKTFGHSRDRKTGKVTVVDMTMTKGQAKSLGQFPWTEGPGKSLKKRAIRNLFG